MKSDFLFELGTEELPPKALSSLSSALTDAVIANFSGLGLSFGEVTAFAAPRRLALRVKDLDQRTADKTQVIWGPPTKVAFSATGEPTRAAESFAQKNDLAVDLLRDHIEHDGQQEKLCLRRTEAGTETRTLLVSIIRQSLTELPIPKPMRWGDQRVQFVRPAQWAVMLFGDQLCEGEILGLKIDNKSRGHRFHYNHEIVVESALSYQQQLRDGFVIADSEERKAIITKGVNDLAVKLGGTPVIDPDLLEEVAALNEWPVPLLGKFDQHFLSVPAEALISSMKEHQKYFHVVDNQGQLMPAFITVANIESRDPTQVIDGNERVIRPRLADAAFFYENDKRASLNHRRSFLKAIVFQAELGSVYDKTERVAAIGQQLADQMGADSTLVKRAAELCKSDLLTDMVGEFADLQGIMGRYYALHDGEHPDVAEALYQQYLPRFAGDEIPSSATGKALAIADRIDSLVGIFSIGQQPSGSKDPFALRRASLGILRIIIEGDLDIDLIDLIHCAEAQYSAVKTRKATGDKLNEQVLTYIMDRFKSWYKDKGHDVNRITSVTCLKLSNPLDISARIEAVKKFTLLPDAAVLAAANKRVSNLLNKQLGDKKPHALDLSLLEDAAEKQLAEQMAALSKTIAPMLEQRNYYGALEKLATLRQPVDHFFDQVMVMTDCEKTRNNRLALLQNLRQLFINVADISQLAPTK